MQITTLHKTLAVGLMLAALACLPTPARAQFTFSFPTTVTIPHPGDLNVPVSGTLTDTSGAPSSFVTEALQVFTAPAGGDVSDLYLYDSAFPATLGAFQTISGPLFFLADQPIDPNVAPVPGIYTGNFSVTYGGVTSGQDFTIQVGASGAPVPETSTLPFVALGAGFVGFAAWRRRATVKASA